MKGTKQGEYEDTLLYCGRACTRMKEEGKNRTGYKSPRQVQGAIPVPGLSHQWLVIRWLNPLKPAVFFHLTNGKPVSSFLLSLVVETP
ncbi:hypothetical protein, partial [uncultured Phocaeicola sp.]|uniref:hypothetical protein n=1 Tax=uncultured Phocaeicola sp. TaxID=990718 RepID=UPI0025A1B59D